jgi:hypothetical protein
MIFQTATCSSKFFDDIPCRDEIFHDSFIYQFVPCITGQRGDMMRAGVSRVVVEIIILVIAVALALLIFSPLSGYIFGSLGKTATVGGTANIRVESASYDTASSTLKVYIRNLGPGTIPAGTWTVYVDGAQWQTLSQDAVDKDGTITISGTLSGFDTTRQHSITVYGPGGVQTQYLYYPPS